MPKTAQAPKKNRGQALLIILLVMAVALTIALSIASRSIADITISQKEEEAARAFSAAEAGIEQALITQSGTSGGLPAGGQFTAVITNLAEGGTNMIVPILLASAETIPIWFVAHDETGALTCSQKEGGKKDEGGGSGPAAPAGVIVAWPSSAGSIPAGWARVSGLDDRYPKGSVNPNQTGGSATHTHTSSPHSHIVGSHSHGGTSGGANEYTAARTSGGESSTAADHTHSLTSGGASSNTSSDGGSWAAASSDPSFYSVIFIESLGTSGIPDRAVAYANSQTAPPGWAQHSGSQARFLKGAGTGDGGGRTGGGAHAHTANAHGHSIQDHAHGGGTSGVSSSVDNAQSPGGTDFSDHPHTHPVSFGGSSLDGAASAASAQTGSADYSPPYYTLQAVQNSVGDNDIPVGIIAMWLGTLDSIPAGWFLADGSQGTPDLREKFVRSAGALGEVGTTGGSLGHSHTDPAGHAHSVNHRHSASLGAGGRQSSYQPGTGSRPRTSHTHNGTTGYAGGTSGSAVQTVDANPDTQPPFRTVAFIQFTGEGEGGGGGGEEEIDPLACFTGNVIQFCWGESGTSSSSATTPALEVSILYTTEPGDYTKAKIARGAYDPNGGRRATNKFSASDIGCVVSGKSFAFGKTITLDTDLGIPQSVSSRANGLQQARVRLLYNTDRSHPLGLSVAFPGNTTIPRQGTKIESVGTAGSASNTTRKIELYQLFPDLPPVFDFGLFSGSGGLTK